MIFSGCFHLVCIYISYTAFCIMVGQRQGISCNKLEKLTTKVEKIWWWKIPILGQTLYKQVYPLGFSQHPHDFLTQTPYSTGRRFLSKIQIISATTQTPYYCVFNNQSFLSIFILMFPYDYSHWLLSYTTLFLFYFFQTISYSFKLYNHFHKLDVAMLSLQNFKSFASGGCIFNTPN